jgi:glycogen phosphorylase
VLALGAETFPGGDPSVFNMAVMGMRLAQRVNGVSQLHGEVSREMFAGLWPGFDTTQVPIGSVTNGVHAPTWVAQEVLDLASNTPEDSAVAQQLPEDGHAWERVAHTAPARLWEIRRALRSRLVRLARQRLRESWRQRGASEAELGWTDEVLDENALTIGFARRVPSYKRLTLILHDQARLTELMLDPERPVQFIIAGKAHPADDGGKRLIQQMVQFSDDPLVRHRIVFLPDYDMAMASALVQGCDVWLNNPLRPLEASGTSGMKSALNGGLNLSIRDGWWDEWYDGADGWAIPSADGVEDAGRRDELESNALYDLLGLTVAPRFYDTGPDGLPRRWLEMVGHTLRALGPRVQASRMVRQYVEELYIPAAQASRALSEGAVGADRAVPASTGSTSTGSTSTGRSEPFAAARELAAWKRRVTRAWGGVRIEHVEGEDGDQGPGGSLVVRATVALGGLSPDDVSVEVVYGRVGDADEILNPAVSPLTIEDGPEDGVARFVGKAELGRPGPFGYTLRVVPRHRLLANAAEMGLVTLPEAPAGLTTGDLR